MVLGNLVLKFWRIKNLMSVIRWMSWGQVEGTLGEVLTLVSEFLLSTFSFLNWSLLMRGFQCLTCTDSFRCLTSSVVFCLLSWLYITRFDDHDLFIFFCYMISHFNLSPQATSVFFRSCFQETVGLSFVFLATTACDRIHSVFDYVFYLAGVGLRDTSLKGRAAFEYCPDGLQILWIISDVFIYGRQPMTDFWLFLTLQSLKADIMLARFTLKGL